MWNIGSARDVDTFTVDPLELSLERAGSGQG